MNTENSKKAHNQRKPTCHFCGFGDLIEAELIVFGQEANSHFDALQCDVCGIATPTHILPTLLNNRAEFWRGFRYAIDRVKKTVEIIEVGDRAPEEFV